MYYNPYQFMVNSNNNVAATSAPDPPIDIVPLFDFIFILSTTSTKVSIVLDTCSRAL